MEAIGGVMARHLETMRNKRDHPGASAHGCAQGQILDADGSELVDLFDEFDITAQPVSFEFSTGRQRAIKTACLELLGLMEDGSGRVLDRRACAVLDRVLPGADHPKEVKTAYQNWQQGAVLINDMRSGFQLQRHHLRGIPRPGVLCAGDGTLGRAASLPQGKPMPSRSARWIPSATYFAPADFNETVNTIGQPLYAKQEPRKFDRGTDCTRRVNPLPMCHRPGVLIKLVAA